MDQITPCEKTERAPIGIARQSDLDAKLILRKEGNLSFFILSFLFCLLVTLAWLSLFGAIDALLVTALQKALPENALYWVEVALVLCQWIAFFMLVFPIWIGRWRLAGMAVVGESASLSEMFHYFTSWRRHYRALLTALAATLGFLLPMAIGLFAFSASFVLYRNILTDVLEAPVATLILVLCLLISALLAVLLFLLSGSYALIVALFIGNEKLRLRDVLRCGFTAWWHNLGTVLRFQLRSLLYFLLSLLTFGILYVFYFAHHYILFDMRLAMALCPKGDPQ